MADVARCTEHPGFVLGMGVGTGSEGEEDACVAEGPPGEWFCGEPRQGGQGQRRRSGQVFPDFPPALRSVMLWGCHLLTWAEPRMGRRRALSLSSTEAALWVLPPSPFRKSTIGTSSTARALHLGLCVCTVSALSAPAGADLGIHL